MSVAVFDGADGIEAFLERHLLMYNSKDSDEIECGVKELNTLTNSLSKPKYKHDIHELLPTLERVVKTLWETLNGISKSSEKESSPNSGSKSTERRTKLLPGLTMYWGWPPIIVILREAFLEVKNLSWITKASVITSQLIDMTGENLQLFAVDIAKPIVEVLGQLVSSGSKAGQSSEVLEAKFELLKTLLKLLDKVDGVLKPLLPEMQKIFLNMVCDKSNQKLRELAAEAQTKVINFHPDPNSLFSEISDISNDCSKRMKDDSILDELIDKTLGRINEVDGEVN